MLQLRGPGGLHQDFLEIDFLVVSDLERSNSYQKLFTKLKNIALSLKYCWSKVNTVVELYCACDFKSPALKIELENLSTPTVFEQSP